MPIKVRTEAMKEKARKTMAKSKKILEKYGYEPTMSKAIRANCLECQGEGRQFVKYCTVTKCPLWPFRMGRKPRDQDLRVAEFSPEGEVIGLKHIEDMDEE